MLKRVQKPAFFRVTIESQEWEIPRSVRIFRTSAEPCNKSRLEPGPGRTLLVSHTDAKHNSPAAKRGDGRPSLQSIRGRATNWSQLRPSPFLSFGCRTTSQSGSSFTRSRVSPRPEPLSKPPTEPGIPWEACARLDLICSRHRDVSSVACYRAISASKRAGGKPSMHARMDGPVQPAHHNNGPFFVRHSDARLGRGRFVSAARSHDASYA